MQKMVDQWSFYFYVVLTGSFEYLKPDHGKNFQSMSATSLREIINYVDIIDRPKSTRFRGILASFAQNDR